MRCNQERSLATSNASCNHSGSSFVEMVEPRPSALTKTGSTIFKLTLPTARTSRLPAHLEDRSDSRPKLEMWPAKLRLDWVSCATRDARRQYCIISCGANSDDRHGSAVAGCRKVNIDDRPSSNRPRLQYTALLSGNCEANLLAAGSREWAGGAPFGHGRSLPILKARRSSRRDAALKPAGLLEQRPVEVRLPIQLQKEWVRWRDGSTELLSGTRPWVKETGWAQPKSAATRLPEMTA